MSKNKFTDSLIHSYYRLGNSNQVFCNTCNKVKDGRGIHKITKQTSLKDWSI